MLITVMCLWEVCFEKNFTEDNSESKLFQDMDHPKPGNTKTNSKRFGNWKNMQSEAIKYQCILKTRRTVFHTDSFHYMIYVFLHLSFVIYIAYID